MYTIEKRKLLIIEEVLKVDNEEVLKALEGMLKNTKTKTPRKLEVIHGD
ncbi:hypothetical protein ACLOAU_09215 [Niabella sp. CJ426]